MWPSCQWQNLTCQLTKWFHDGCFLVDINIWCKNHPTSCLLPYSCSCQSLLVSEILIFSFLHLWPANQPICHCLWVCIWSHLRPPFLQHEMHWISWPHALWKDFPLSRSQGHAWVSLHQCFGLPTTTELSYSYNIWFFFLSLFLWSYRIFSDGYRFELSEKRWYYYDLWHGDSGPWLIQLAHALWFYSSLTLGISFSSFNELLLCLPSFVACQV